MQRKDALECMLGAFGAMVLFSLLFASYMMYEAPNAGPIFTITMMVWGYFGYRCTGWAWTSLEDVMRRKFGASQGGLVMTCLLGALVAPVAVPVAFLLLAIRCVVAGDPPPAPAAAAQARNAGPGLSNKPPAVRAAMASAATAEARSRWERRNEAAQDVPDEDAAEAGRKPASAA